jgi:endo-1,4-beta-xylanase
MARPALAQTAEAEGLGRIARASGITFGAAMRNDHLAADPDYERAFNQEAAVIVPEYEGKFAALQPKEGEFDTAPLDALLRWGAAQARQVRGHALVWHTDLPDWAHQALGQGRDRAISVLGAHMDRVLSHTRAQIRDWDVVNEPIADPPGSDTPQAGPSPLRDTPWLRAMGPDYVETALRMARQRDPTLRLTINEYGVEEDTPWAEEKRRRLLTLVRGLLERGTPLDAVGIQAHLQLRNPFRAEPFAAFVGTLRQAGLAVLITEMDIRETAAAPADLAARDKLVAERAYAFTRCAVEAGVRTVLTWGLSDKYSWLASEPAVALPEGRQHRGLPLDGNWKRKAMWDAMARAFAGK